MLIMSVALFGLIRDTEPFTDPDELKVLLAGLNFRAYVKIDTKSNRNVLL